MHVTEFFTEILIMPPTAPKGTYLFFILLFSFSFYSCKQKPISEEAEINVTTHRLIETDTTINFDYVAEIMAEQNVEIRSRVKGYLEVIYIDEGKPVKKGQQLFKINDDDYKVNLAQTKASLKNAIASSKAAEYEVERSKQLAEKNIIATSEYEIANAKYDAYNAQIDEAKAKEEEASIRLSHTTIRAPFDGLVDRIMPKGGSLIDEGSLLTTISNIKYVYAYFNVSEKEYLTFIKKILKDENDSIGSVELILADGTLYASKGRVETMESEFNRNTGSISFRAKFANPQEILKHGSSGKVRLIEKNDNIILLPQQAVFEIQDKYYVYLVGADNKAYIKSFIPEKRINNKYIIKSGLKAGDNIVLEGIQNIKNGSKLQILNP